MHDEQDELTSGAAIEIPEAAFAAVFTKALREAERKAKKYPFAADEITDATTDALLWCRGRCADLDTFEAFALATAKTWIWRTVSHLAEKRKRRGETVSIETVDGGESTRLAAREAKPTRPLMIEELPEDLAAVVRFYFVDGYDMRDVAFLTGQSRATVERKLKRAAELLAAGRIKPERRKREKLLSAG